MGHVPEAWSVEDVERRCGVLREQLAVAAADLVTPGELAAVWPGGAENPHPAPACWWYCWGTYIAFARRMQKAEAPAVADAQVRAIIARRSARQPERVTLASGQRVAVYPKSYWALRFLDFLDRELRLAAAAGQAWLEDVSVEGQRVAALAPLAEGLAVRVWAWILTHESAELPFRDADDDLTPPAWTAALTAPDLLALARAHAVVHAEDLQVIALAFPSEPGESRLGIEGFLNSYAGEQGAESYAVFRQFSLGEIFANAVARAQTMKEAEERAKGNRTREVTGAVAGLEA